MGGTELRAQVGPSIGGTLVPTQVSVLAPFSVPLAIDPRVLAERGHGEVQGEIWDRLPAPEYWREDRVAGRRYHDFNSQLAERLRDAAPQWLLQAEPDALLRTICNELPGLQQLPVTFQGHALTLRLRSADLGVMSFGFGTVTLHLDVEDGTPEPAWTCLEDGSTVIEVIEQLGPVLSRYLADIGTAVPEEICSRQGVTKFHSTSRPECLWGHDLLSFEASAEEVLRAYPDLAPSAEISERATVEVRGATFVPGLGTSLVTGAPDVAPTLAPVLALQQAFYAATASTERALSTQVGGLASRRAQRESAKPRGWREGGLESLHELMEIVTAYRSIFTTLDIHLAASVSGESRVWQATSQMWRLNRQIDAIDHHLAALRETAEHMASEESSTRTTALTFAAFTFTVIAALGAFLDAIEFSQGSPLGQPDSLRVGINIGLVAALAFLTGFLARRLK